MSERDVIGRSDRPATVDSLAGDLRRLGLRDGDIVLVHSSLSALGWVVGGAQAVAQAIRRVIGESGTIVVPTHTGQLTDPAAWSDPPVPPEWYALIRASMPAFDPHVTIPRRMGAITECIRTSADARRSSHPIVSFAAVGPHAEEIVRDHPLAPSLGDGSPLSRVYDLDGRVLLLGVGHVHNTSLHLAEHRAEFPGKTSKEEGVAMLVDGERRWVTYTDLDLDTSDFDRLGEAIEAAGVETVGPVGAGTGRLASQRHVVDLAADWMARHRDAGSS